MKNKLLQLFILFFTLVGITACNDDQRLGFGMLQPSDILTTKVDSTSTTISFKTVLDDTIRSSKITYMVGELSDETFGKLRAGYATRLYLQGMIGDIDSLQFTLDSVCFRLSKSSTYFYGDTTQSQTFSVYELEQNLTVEDCQNYCEQATKPTCLASIKKIIDMPFPAYQDTTSSYRIKLDAEYATELYNKILLCYNVDSSLQHFDSLFIQQFKGVYVTTKDDIFNNVGAVVTHCVPEMTFYFHNADTTTTMVFAPSPQSYSSPLSSDESQIYLQAVNVFEHSYPTEISSTIDNNASTAYAQGMVGLKTIVNLENIESWRDSTQLNCENPLEINMAKLQIPLKKYTYEYLPLVLRVYDAERNMIVSTTAVTQDSTTCEFYIHSFLLYLFEHSAQIDQYSMEIVVPENNAYANGFVFDGTLTDKLKLVITYTK